LLGADRHVVPKQVVGVELLFQALSQSALARRHARHAIAKRWNEGCHMGDPAPEIVCGEYLVYSPHKLR
jgi:hypothetical protein